MLSMKAVGLRAAGGEKLGALLSPGAVRAHWGLQQAWLHTSMTMLSVCLSPAVVVPEISPVDLQVATVKVRSCVHVSVSLRSWVTCPCCGQAVAIPIRAPATLCPCRPQTPTQGWREPSPSPLSVWSLWVTMGSASPSRTSSKWRQLKWRTATSGASSEAMGLGQGGENVAQLLPAARQRCRHGQDRLARGQSHPGVLPWAWWQGGVWRDGSVLPGMSHGIAVVPVLTGWPATSIAH